MITRKRLALIAWVLFYALLIAGLVAVAPEYEARHCHTSGRYTTCDLSPDRS